MIPKKNAMTYGVKEKEYRRQYRLNNLERSKKQSLEWNKKNRKRLQQTNRDWYKRNKTKFITVNRRNRLKKEYGITLEQYDQMVINQNSMCAICGELSNKLVIDHNHTTGKVRALLCANCNSGIGMLKENLNILLSAVNYIKRF